MSNSQIARVKPVILQHLRAMVYPVAYPCDPAFTHPCTLATPSVRMLSASSQRPSGYIYRERIADDCASKEQFLLL